jgi:hypothetical protein
MKNTNAKIKGTQTKSSRRLTINLFEHLLPHLTIHTYLNTCYNKQVTALDLTF